LLEVAEGHDGLAAIFLSEIGGYRICTCRFWKSIINQNQLSEPKFRTKVLKLIGLTVR
jgi:hypothetical protein